MGFLDWLLGRKPMKSSRPSGRTSEPTQAVDMQEIKANLTQFAKSGKTIEFLKESVKVRGSEIAEVSAEVLVSEPAFAETLAEALASPYAPQLIDTARAAHLLMRAIRRDPRMGNSTQIKSSLQQAVNFPDPFVSGNAEEALNILKRASASPAVPSPQQHGVVIKNVRGEVLCRLEAESTEGADLTGLNLRNADLRGANLHGARLSSRYENSRWVGTMQEADLSGADLTGATITTECNLNGANLKGANLRGATIHTSYLKSANLQGACLQNVTIVSTHFSNANLQEADFSNVTAHHPYFDRAVLNNANFSGAQIINGTFEQAKLEGVRMNGMRYNKFVKWPPEFNPAERGAMLKD